MRATAGGADDDLCEFLLNQSLEIPGLALRVSPDHVRIQVVRQADQRESQLLATLARQHLGVDHIADRVFVIVRHRAGSRPARRTARRRPTFGLGGLEAPHHS